jgi:hypothetical protein
MRRNTPIHLVQSSPFIIVSLCGWEIETRDERQREREREREKEREGGRKGYLRQEVRTGNEQKNSKEENKFGNVFLSLHFPDVFNNPYIPGLNACIGRGGVTP